MKLYTLFKIVLLILVLTLTASVIRFRLYDPIVMSSIADTARSYYYDRKDDAGLVVPGNKSDTSQYVPAYKDLPPNYLHTGHMLIYYSGEKRPLDSFCRESFRYTRYLKLSDYKKRLRETNTIPGDTIPANVFITIPGTVGNFIYDLNPDRERKLVDARTLYYTGKSICSSSVLAQIPEFKNAGINAVVFDVKDVPGHISYLSSVPEVVKLDSHRYRHTDDMRKIVRYLKSHDIYTIARIACFRDAYVTAKRPEWAIRSSRTGGVWNQGTGEVWLDPTNRHVQDYTIAVALEAARLGVDEIQFDYIRFPTDGDQSDAVFAYSYGRISREETITRFLKRAYAELKKEKVFVSIDIFGVVAWGYRGDISRTGQDISMLAPYCDIISPMLYHSHFNDNFHGYA
ncbi:MAG: putative glycoside hydrolase, partial [Spirochaetota bacterium]